MAHRQQSLFQDLFEIAAKLPWWIGIALAVAFYLILHQLAAMELATATSASIISGATIQNFIKGVASILQYILPPAFLAGSGVSLLSRRK